MTLAHLYDEFREEFETDDLNSSQSATSAEENLQAFENGYQSGWQDATTAHGAEQERVLSELAQNFQDMQFTYHEARSKLLISLRPIATVMLEKLLPGVSREALRSNLTEQINEVLTQSTEDSIEINVSPESLSAVQGIMDAQKDLSFIIKENANLGAAQADLRSSQLERHIDIEDMCERISQTLTAFVQQSSSEVSYG
jgi:flagellar assembly protein FliH